MKVSRCRHLFGFAAFLVIAAGFSFAQQPGTATIKVTVSPEEAYIFIDGHPYDHRSQTLKLAPGGYTIGVYNYGFVPQVQKVTLAAGDNAAFEARLKPVPGRINGPWGRIQIEGNPDDTAAVFLNGTTPDYFVGHIDEMNNDVWLAQQLIVPVGTYQMFIINPRETKPFWTGTVEVRLNERVIVDIAKPASAWKYVPWKEATLDNEVKRFEASTATATIAVAPVTANLRLDKTQINCGEPVRLAWTSKEAADVVVTANGLPLGKLPLTGDQMMNPKQTTTYELRATGPGGIITSTATVNVNTSVRTSLAASPADVRYHQIGNDVVDQGVTTLNWTAANADTVSIDPLGPVTGTNGAVPLTLHPAETSAGLVDETKTYTITASNACGGSDTSKVAVRLSGSIEPQVAEVKPPELPQTASPLPLLALLGLGSLASGFVLRRIRKGL
jgi:LPXTG-motif cell wall-anchored protein